MNAMKAWFLNLQYREKLILVAGGTAALVIIAWMFVLTPLRSGSAGLRESVAQKERLLINLSRVEALRLDSASPASAGEQSLVVLVDNTAQSYGLALPRTRPDGPDGINVSFTGVSFDAMLEWLSTLEATHGVSVESATFSSARERGLVNGQIFLRRS